jgi:hypothetical protein
MAKNFAADYVTVAQRIEAFYKAYPEGSIQSQIVEMTDKRVVVQAHAYRNAQDPRPGIGHSSMNIPGSTPYTRGSELENTETSAWGRAIAALGFETKAGIATADEVANKSGNDTTPRQSAYNGPTRPERPASGHSTPPAVDGELTLGQAMDALKFAGVDPKAVSAKGRELFGTWSLKEMTGNQRAAVVAALTDLTPVPEAPPEDFDDIPF